MAIEISSAEQTIIEMLVKNDHGTPSKIEDGICSPVDHTTRDGSTATLCTWQICYKVTGVSQRDGKTYTATATCMYSGRYDQYDKPPYAKHLLLGVVIDLKIQEQLIHNF